MNVECVFWCLQRAWYLTIIQQVPVEWWGNPIVNEAINRLLDQLTLALHELSRELAKRGLFLLRRVDLRAHRAFL